jgi:diguanylate cyclase (GGDEF)-like protein
MHIKFCISSAIFIFTQWLVSATFNVFANEESSSFYIPIYSLNAEVEELTAAGSHDVDTKIELLAKLSDQLEQLNSAEKYIYLVSKSDTVIDIHQKIIYLLEAQSLESSINEDQLTYLPFLILYKKMAVNYAELGEYKKAYEAKEIYINKYDAYLEEVRHKHIISLEKKYETEQKKDINTLLNNQTELKAIEINESLTDEVIQRRNLYIVSFFIIISAFLLFRVLSTKQKFQELSKEDALTGVKNRRTLFRHGENAIRKSIKSHTRLCLIALKIDDFKLLNDIHGDYIGDELLKKVASLGMEAMRTRDVFGRLEDATFIAILPEVSQDEAKAIAQHLKEKIYAFKFDYVGLIQPLETSFAIVELSEAQNNFELLLNTSMNVLYEISDGGGNQIRTYS